MNEEKTVKNSKVENNTGKEIKRREENKKKKLKNGARVKEGEREKKKNKVYH